MKVYSRYGFKRTVGSFEVTDDFDEVQRSGFVPSDVRIKSYINAGVALAEARKQQYQGDGSDSDFDLEPLPAMAKGYDVVDAERDMRRLSDERKQRIKEFEVQQLQGMSAQGQGKGTEASDAASKEPAGSTEKL